MATSHNSPLRVLPGAIRDGWLIVGITLALLLLAEGAYRLVSSLRHPPRARATASPLHPYAREPWWPQFRGPLGVEGRKNRWDAYRGWRSAAYRVPGITVDTAGVRLTVPPPRDSATALQVVMLGGSAMWGQSARDSFTIPSQLAQRLRSRGLDNVQVTNLGLPGYNVTQEATTLLFELARDRRPDVVVTMDGYNDWALAFLLGGVGRTYSEDINQFKLDLAARGFWGEFFGLGRHSALVRGLTGVRAEPLGVEDLPMRGAEVCGPAADYYGTVVRSMEAMSREFGFELVMFQQPVDATSRKPRTEWERSFMGPGYRLERFRQCAAAFDSVMGRRLDRTYFSLASLFDQDTTSVFTDKSSHTTERANGVIADRMAGVLLPLLRARAARGRPGP